MVDTYTQLYIHIVFAVKGRQPLIPKEYKDELHNITGIITNKKQKLIQINSMVRSHSYPCGHYPRYCYLGSGKRHKKKRNTIH